MKNTITIDNNNDFKREETLTFFVKENFDFKVKTKLFSAEVLKKIQT